MKVLGKIACMNAKVEQENTQKETGSGRLVEQLSILSSSLTLSVRTESGIETLSLSWTKSRVTKQTFRAADGCPE